MSTRNTVSRSVHFASFVLAFAAANFALGQTTLDQLEKQIRGRTGQEPQPSAATLLESEAGPMLSKDSAEPGYLGVRADDRQDRGRGVRAIGIDAGSPAAKNGLKKNDLITGVDGVRIRQLTEMADVMSLYYPGQTVEFEVIRDNKPMKLKVTLGRRPTQNASGNPATESIPAGEAIPQGPLVLEGPTLDMPDEPTTANPPTPISPDITSPESVPTRITIDGDAPTLEKLQKRIDQLEKRVEQLEKALAESKKK
jgi:membrane-associated protease RseP (regulator of RpoE activity)